MSPREETTVTWSSYSLQTSPSTVCSLGFRSGCLGEKTSPTMRDYPLDTAPSRGSREHCVCDSDGVTSTVNPGSKASSPNYSTTPMLSFLEEGLQHGWLS